jgi:hypothetical protein
MEQTARLSRTERPSEGHYYCHFCYPPDNDEKKLAHTECRWWPIWHEYEKVGGRIIYGSQVRITPNRTPDPKKMIAWADVVNLGSSKVRIMGPFDFDNPSSRPREKGSPLRQYVHANLWNELFGACNERGIIPPRLLAPRKVRVRKRKADM